MSGVRKAFLEAIEKAPKDYSHRYVYADWLDEMGEHEEADRQRKFEKSEKWLRTFATAHRDFGYMGENEDCDARDFPECCGYHQLIYFLDQHVGDHFYLPFDTPYFNEYSEQLWDAYATVTCRETPQNEYRRKMPPFRCSC